MYGRTASRLVKELASNEANQLSSFNVDLIDQVIKECDEHHSGLQKMMRYNRAQIIQDLRWKVGHTLPQEIKEKLNHREVEYFKNHSDALEKYISVLDLDLTVDMVPPNDPYLKIRVLEDIGHVPLGDQSSNLARHSIHFLKRTDAERFISLGLMEELSG